MENKKLFDKLLEAQKKIGAVTKDKTNPFFKSNYADINAFIDVVKPVLTEVGIVLLQPLTNIEGEPAIKTVLMSGDEKIEEIVVLPKNPDPQKMGSTITYFRRYALQSLLFLQAEDDDGNNASDKKTTYIKSAGAEKECPICKKKHTGQYPKCLDCWKAGQQETKTKKVVNGEVEPF